MPRADDAKSRKAADARSRGRDDTLSRGACIDITFLRVGYFSVDYFDAAILNGSSFDIGSFRFVHANAEFDRRANNAGW